MAEDDIYGSKRHYEAFKHNLSELLIPPEPKEKRKYYCKNKANLAHFEKLFSYFEAKDLSYIRRLRLSKTLRLISHATNKDFKDCEREDIDAIVAFMHNQYKSSKSKHDFIRDIKYLWRVLLPEKDEKGRVDDKVFPYPVRHLSARIDKSREKLRGDKLTFEEFEKIVTYFSNDARMQLFLCLSLESLARPQELLYTKINGVELHDNYAKIWIAEHGKEGTGFLQCIDSYPYLMKWLEKHPLRKNKDSFLFVNLSDRDYGKQLRPQNINKKLRTACKYLKIDKPVTAYSLKRNGVTFRRLRGDSDVEIQHAARWTSTQQLKTYDLSQQDDAFKVALVRRGIVKDEKYKQFEPKTRDCTFCNAKNAFTDEFCSQCKRPLDRNKIAQEQQQKDKEYVSLKGELDILKRQMAKRERAEGQLSAFIKPEEIKKLFKTVYKLQKQLEEKKN